jgi:hypothetical protein
MREACKFSSMSQQREGKGVFLSVFVHRRERTVLPLPQMQLDVLRGGCMQRCLIGSVGHTMECKSAGVKLAVRPLGFRNGAAIVRRPSLSIICFACELR